MRTCTNAEITKEQIENLLTSALDQLYKNDGYLVDNRPYLKEKNGNHHVGERSIVFRLAHYMQNILDSNPVFQNYVLDCEYNRNGIQAKALPSFPNGVYPDIIIHNRGNNDNNLLILEVKTYWNTDNMQDERKISEFLDPKGAYRFSFGVSLMINDRREDTQFNLQCPKNRSCGCKKMSVMNNQKLDYREMFDVAKEFAETASLAAGKHDLETEGWSRPRIIPEIVNRAFACEVFLKSLLVFSDIPFRKEHELKNLWLLLPPELQNEVGQELSSRYGFGGQDDFEALLKKTSNAFADWRYIYELHALSGFPGFLAAFSDSLREICCQKYHHSTWEEYKRLL